MCSALNTIDERSYSTIVRARIYTVRRRHKEKLFAGSERITSRCTIFGTRAVRRSRLWSRRCRNSVAEGTLINRKVNIFPGLDKIHAMRLLWLRLPMLTRGSGIWKIPRHVSPNSHENRPSILHVADTSIDDASICLYVGPANGLLKTLVEPSIGSRGWLMVNKKDCCIMMSLLARWLKIRFRMVGFNDAFISSYKVDR